MRKTCGSPRAALVGAALLTGSLAVTSFVLPAHAQQPAPPAPPAASAPTTAPTPAPEKADPKAKAAAKKAYKAGQDAFEKQDYRAAAESFKLADETLPSPFAKYWAAKALDLSDPNDQQLPQKIERYEAFLAGADPADATLTDKVAEARARLEELKAKTVHVLTLRVLSQCEKTTDGRVCPAPKGWATLVKVAVDGVEQPSPLLVSNTDADPKAAAAAYDLAVSELTLSPGKHKVAVSADGYVTQEFEVVAAGGEKQAQEIELLKVPPVAAPPPPVAPPPEPQAPPPPQEQESKVPAIVTLSIAGAATAVGATFGVLALRDKSDFDDKPTAAKADDVERNALIADMSFGVAITLGVTGIVLLTSKDEQAVMRRLERQRQAKFEIVPQLGRTSGGASARLRF